MKSLFFLLIISTLVFGNPLCPSGVSKDEYCCPAICGTCAGPDCSLRPGGLTCCGSYIRSLDRQCSEHSPPCLTADPLCEYGVLGLETDCYGDSHRACEPCPDTDELPNCDDNSSPCQILPDLPDPTCIDGIINNDVCCRLECGVCGGPGCSLLPGGSSGCCMSSIRNSDINCDEFPAPCLIVV